MSQNPRSRKSRKKAAIMPTVDPEVAQRHLAAYFYALYGGCDCEACQLLRPIAEKMLKNLKKSRREVIQTG